MNKIAQKKKELTRHTALLDEDDPQNTTGMSFSVMTFSEQQEVTTVGETAFLLLKGRGTVSLAGESYSIERSSLFDENPWTFVLPPGATLTFSPEEPLEFAITSTTKTTLQQSRVFTPDEVSVERRGKGLLEGTCYRLVKLVFDRTIFPESSLVIGEVVNQPGRWSSYPPHHHDQPELYYYRFQPEQGFGFAQFGDEVRRVEAGTLSIIEGVDHSQVAAPGYAMWYLWAVRHLEGDPYLGFEFTKDHEWTMDENAKVWNMEEK